MIEYIFTKCSNFISVNLEFKIKSYKGKHKRIKRKEQKKKPSWAGPSQHASEPLDAYTFLEMGFGPRTSYKYKIISCWTSSTNGAWSGGNGIDE